ncbi:MAG: hypothetical protein MI723_14470, partial [Caulobacterales bacterium]|nr:hypothetical protein [Caulobacterales bacterium]
EREAADGFMRREAAAAGQALGEARALDALLNAVPAQEASADLRARVLAAAPAAAPAPFWAGVGRLLPGGGGAIAAQPAVLLLAMLTLGLAAGYFGGHAAASRDAADAFLDYALAAPDTVFSIEG